MYSVSLTLSQKSISAEENVHKWKHCPAGCFVRLFNKCMYQIIKAKICLLFANLSVLTLNSLFAISTYCLHVTTFLHRCLLIFLSQLRSPFKNFINNEMKTSSTFIKEFCLINKLLTRHLKIDKKVCIKRYFKTLVYVLS